MILKQERTEDLIMSNNKDDFETEETPEHHDLIRSNTKDDFEQNTMI